MGPKLKKPKEIKDSTKSSIKSHDSWNDLLADSNISESRPVRSIDVMITLKGETPGPVTTKKGPINWRLLFLFDSKIINQTLWEHEKKVKFSVPINLLDPDHQRKVVEKPLILLLRTSGGKVGKDPDPLIHTDNRAGGTVDLMPLLVGANEIDVKVRLLTPLGEEFGCKVKVYAIPEGAEMTPLNLVPLAMTMVSGHCFPPSNKDNTVFISAIGLDGLLEVKPAIHFGMSLSNAAATKIFWADACTGGQMLNSHYNVPNDDLFIPADVDIKSNEFCMSTYWNTVKRVLVDPIALRKRLSTSFLFEVAGVPRFATKVDVRGRYMGLIDARTLLEPNQTTLLTCAKLKYFDEAELPEDIGPLLELPPASTKSSARSKSPQVCADLQGHTPYVIIKFDLIDPVVPKIALVDMFQTIGFPVPEKHLPLNELYIEPPPEDPMVDVTKIRHECGALAVHKELSNLACRGPVQMNQSIKRTAANKLLTRVRTMLKQFSPGECSYVDWQDTVTAQHAASRRAVNSSFRPQPPPQRVSVVSAAARARMAGDMRVAAKHIASNLEAHDTHPRHLLAKAIRCLEAMTDTEANFYVLKAIDGQARNRYLLWLLGGIKFDKGEESLEVARAAFQIAVKGDYSDGVACTIGWAALHTLYHFEGNRYGAFVAAKKMRKFFELPRKWREYYEHWVETSGEEEVLWIPESLSVENPFIIASAFFLCIRCYKFSELLLQCLELECATRGSRLNIKTNISSDVYYLRAASLLLRRRKNEALAMMNKALRRFGPSATISQMRLSCLLVEDELWNEECEKALGEVERSGAEIPSAILLRAALGGMKLNLDRALQRAGRAHKRTPCAYTALAIARIFNRKGEHMLAEKWAAGAVKLEPWLADGWAFLAILAMGERDVEKARAMLRTAHQAGPISPDIEHQVKKVMKIVRISALPDSMTKNLCLCDYLHPVELEDKPKIEAKESFTTEGRLASFVG
ncbi:hypothetical protein NE865_12617 [Phthorimaea operculella]|nr:hypothetical protein NE865_12617 [Phthorimaea operculella]